MAPPAPFAVSSEDLAGGVRAIAICGELDLSTAPELERALDAAVAAGVSILLDLSTCEFIDSTGIAMIVRAQQRLADGDGDGAGRRVVICSGNEQVRRVLEVTGLEVSIPVHASREAALAALRDS